MIYKTNGNKKTRKYGRKYKRNMRGGGEWSMGMGLPILVFVVIVVFFILVMLGIILKRGGSTAEVQ